MTSHIHQWGNTQKISARQLGESCACGEFCVIEFPPDAPPCRNILPDGGRVAGFAHQEALTHVEEERYRAVLGL